ncbi:MAG: replicative DNA helicase [Cognaticolwellia sp.]
METRQFPQSLDAERAILGGLLLDHEQIPSIGEVLVPEDFYTASHAKIFELMLAQSSKGDPLDVLGLHDYIVASNTAEDFGGLSYITSLPEQVPSTENLEYYAKLVKEKSVLRQLIRVSAEINRKVMDGSEDLAELLNFAEQEVFQVAQQRSKKDWLPLNTLLDEQFEKLEQRASNSGEVTGIPTGFIDMDRILAGFQRSDLIVLAARPAMGKTALALNFAQRAAIAGYGVGVFSLEMAAGQLAMRVLGSEARVDAGKMRTGMLSKAEDWPALEAANETLYHAPMFIDDSPGLSITQVRSKARRLKARNPNLSLIVIDYLQLMSANAQSREQEISAISRGLKHMAKELDLPVLALSQLNRAVEQRADKRPMVSDLRESGAIEQDADIIMFIYRDEYYNPDTTTEPNVAEIIIAKQRNGPTGTVKLFFEGKFTRFENLEQNQGYVG